MLVTFPIIHSLAHELIKTCFRFKNYQLNLIHSQYMAPIWGFVGLDIQFVMEFETL